MTQDLHAVCAAVAEATWQLFEDRADETVDCTEVEVTPGDWPKRAQSLRDVALRIRKKQGQLFASGADTKYLALVSNRWELAPAALLRWHWQKAGTIELVHDITKNELGAAVPPLRRQRGLVPAEPPHLHQTERAQVPGPPVDPERRVPQATALDRLHPRRTARRPRGPGELSHRPTSPPSHRPPPWARLPSVPCAVRRVSIAQPMALARSHESSLPPLRSPGGLREQCDMGRDHPSLALPGVARTLPPD